MNLCDGMKIFGGCLWYGGQDHRTSFYLTFTTTPVTCRSRRNKFQSTLQNIFFISGDAGEDNGIGYNDYFLFCFIIYRIRASYFPILTKNSQENLPALFLFIK